MQPKNKSLVIFDVEGVLIPKRRYLFLAVSKWLNIRGILLTMILGLLYEVGMMSLESALRRIYKLFKGVRLKEFSQTFREIHLIPGALELFQTLREKGYRTALLSSGLPTLYVEDLAKRLGADYAFGLKLETVDGHLIGEIKGDIIKPGGKATVLRRLLKDGGFSPDYCVVVADDRNNIPLLPLCSKSIGYNPDFLFTTKCSYVIKGNLSNILPYVESKPQKSGSSTLSSGELFRETIHIGSFLIPLLCKYLEINAWLVGALIILVTMVYVVSEFARQKGAGIPLFSRITSKAAVGEENWGFATAPILFALGILVPLLVFPVPIGYVSIAVLTLGDGFAAIFGKKFGSIPIPLDKSKKLEGTLLGFLSAFLGTLFFIDPARGLVAAAVGMLVESTPSPINDNISIPILSGLVIMAIP